MSSVNTPDTSVQDMLMMLAACDADPNPGKMLNGGLSGILGPTPPNYSSEQIHQDALTAFASVSYRDTARFKNLASSANALNIMSGAHICPLCHLSVSMLSKCKGPGAYGRYHQDIINIK